MVSRTIRQGPYIQFPHSEWSFHSSAYALRLVSPRHAVSLKWRDTERPTGRRSNRSILISCWTCMRTRTEAHRFVYPKFGHFIQWHLLDDDFPNFKFELLSNHQFHWTAPTFLAVIDQYRFAVFRTGFRLIMEFNLMMQNQKHLEVIRYAS